MVKMVASSQKDFQMFSLTNLALLLAGVKIIG
jgi:hypothetical protein